ncbi:hypothetical protein [Solirubrum puertoriconensis]|uniref:hypothetical protein n=1 Tax=Solirubrum puertoriconensis TaxID=1751427 RepID=UPI00073F2776|nr:hypothetical protein [Solirubrum puertoriconensis]
MTAAGQLQLFTGAAAQYAGKPFPPAKWASLESGQWLLVRLNGYGGVYYFQLLENKLSHPGAPCLCLAQPDGQTAAILRRREIRSLAPMLSPLEIKELAYAISDRR